MAHSYPILAWRETAYRWLLVGRCSSDCAVWFGEITSGYGGMAGARRFRIPWVDDMDVIDSPGVESTSQGGYSLADHAEYALPTYPHTALMDMPGVNSE